MFRRLRRRLILIYTLSTGFILSLTMLVIYQLNNTQTEKNVMEHCVMTMDSIANELQADQVADKVKLSEIENQKKCMIYIEDNGIPITYEGVYQPRSNRKVLFEALRSKAEAEGIYTKIRPISMENKRSAMYSIRGEEGDQYFGCVLLLPGADSYLTLMILYSKDSLQSSYYSDALLYLGVGMVGILFLFLISWGLIHKVMQPVDENNKKQKEFVACASHELRSPLAYIQAANSTLEKECLEYLPINQKKFLKEYVNNTSQECGRMSRLIEDMLLLASAERKTWTVRKQAVDLDSFLIDSYEKLNQICHQQKHQLTIELPDTLLGKGYLDAHRIYQILQTLVNNALSYTMEDTLITITAERKRNLLQLEVIDHGPGMTEEAKKRVFDRYYRVDQAHKDNNHFGLGLSIAKELVSLHSGKIKILDTPGGGATFQILLNINMERSKNEPKEFHKNTK